MYEQYPGDYIKKRTAKEIKSLRSMYYFFGLTDFGLAVVFLWATAPGPRWALVWAGNVMFIALMGAYWITKAEDLKKKKPYER